jgi:hypothetical protein
VLLFHNHDYGDLINLKYSRFLPCRKILVSWNIKYRCKTSLKNKNQSISYIFPIDKLIPTNERKVKSPPWELEKFIDNQILFIDDDTENIPLRPCIDCHLLMVDWLELDKQFRERGIY